MKIGMFIIGVNCVLHLVLRFRLLKSDELVDCSSISTG